MSQDRPPLMRTPAIARILSTVGTGEASLMERPEVFDSRLMRVRSDVYRWIAGKLYCEDAASMGRGLRVSLRR